MSKKYSLTALIVMLLVFISGTVLSRAADIQTEDTVLLAEEVTTLSEETPADSEEGFSELKTEVPEPDNLEEIIEEDMLDEMTEEIPEESEIETLLNVTAGDTSAAEKADLPEVLLEDTAKMLRMPVPASTLVIGSEGDEVRKVQQIFSELGYLPASEITGKYSIITAAAATLFQSENGLADPDGKVGSWTVGQINGTPVPFRELMRGLSGNDVLVMQRTLKKYGYLSVAPDGTFGAYSEEAVKKFQLYNGLPISGRADLSTLLQLYGTPRSYRSLSQGSSGSEVAVIEQLLQQFGYFDQPADGKFDDLLSAAVMAFQAGNDLKTPDGIFGNWSTGLFINGTVKPFRVLQYGQNGADVLVLQNRLKALGYLSATPDGIFGNQTDTALKRFQMMNGLSVTGQADLSTLYRLYSGNALKKRSLSQGMNGADVLFLQNKLKELGYLPVSPDGIFGKYTYAALCVFQTENGLTAPDGIFGDWSAGLMMNGQAKAFYEINKGASGSVVKTVQRLLCNKYFLEVTPDGIFGNQTEAALKKLEKNNKIAEQGFLNLDTFIKLFLSEPYMSPTAYKIISFGKQFIGTPYVYGGTSLVYGLDCSSFTQQCFAWAGIALYRVSYQQVHQGLAVPLGVSNYKPGDLIFYNVNGAIGHVSIYIGEGKVLQSAQSVGGVCISDYNYNGNIPVQVRRLIPQ